MLNNQDSSSKYSSIETSKRSPCRVLATAFIGILFLILLLPTTAFFINAGMCLSTLNDMKTADDLMDAHVDYIMVLGAGIEADGTPSPILQERLDTAIDLYQNHTANKIIVSGGSDAAQSEITAMLNYLVIKGIPEDSILCDALGVNTYASANNLATIYHAKSAVIVSQRFHLYRAVFIAKHFDIDVYGCPSSTENITDQDLLYREFLARVKDFTQVTLGTLPKPITQLAEWSYLQLTPYIQR